MTTKEATMIANGLAKGLKDADVIGHADFELYTEKEKEMVLNAYRQLGTTTTAKVITKAAGKTKTKAAKKPTAKKSAKPVKKTDKKPAAKKNGTDAQLRELILAGKTNAAALKTVLAKNKDVKTTIACASWNRSQLRNNWKKYGFTKNPNVGTDREAEGNRLR